MAFSPATALGSMIVGQEQRGRSQQFHVLTITLHGSLQGFQFAL